MGKFRRRLLSGQAGRNIDFADLCRYLEQPGFRLREGQGSHKSFSWDDIGEIINLQPEGSVAKSYQARQVRVTIEKCKLTEERTDEEMITQRNRILSAGGIISFICIIVVVYMFWPWYIFHDRQGTIQGIVTNPAKHPLTNAAVRLSIASLDDHARYVSSLEMSMVTDSHGHYELPCSPGLYLVSLGVPDQNYISVAQKVKVYPSRNVTVNFLLRCD